MIQAKFNFASVSSSTHGKDKRRYVEKPQIEIFGNANAIIMAVSTTIVILIAGSLLFRKHRKTKQARELSPKLQEQSKINPV